MRIAEISPLIESVPPRFYGGTERIISYLTEELVKKGHEVVLFASGDSKTLSGLVPVCECALRNDPYCVDPVAIHFIMAEKVLRMQQDFDIIHSHVDYIGFMLGRRTDVPLVSTLHGRLDLRDHKYIFQEYSEMPLVSISYAQRLPLRWGNWSGNVYHGLPVNLYSLNEKGGDYLVYVGRISPEKKVDSAINIALKAGLKLKIAAKIDRVDREYFEAEIRPLMNNSMVEFMGEINDREKNELIGSALAFLHSVDWPEPFGVSLLEAMACGTPVIARRRGSIPEIIEHGVTGYIFEEDDEAAGYIKNLCQSFSRRLCRQNFEERFSAERMTDDYLGVFGRILEAGRRKIQCL